MNSSTVPGTADYTLTTTVALPAPTGPPPGTPNISLDSTVTTGSTTVGVRNTTGLAVGSGVSGTGIPSGTTISAINTGLSQVTLSQSATTSGHESLTFSPTIAPPQVVALVEPAGGIVTPSSTSTQGPLTILAGSHGFSSTGVYDYLATKQDTSGQTLQALGLSFYGQGLQANGILNFSLNVANQNSPPQLVSQTAGITIKLDIPGSSTSTGSTNTSSSSGSVVSATEVPEPLSLLLWGMLAGVGLFRVHPSRRSSHATCRD
jgi:hypothetical protein